MKKVILISLLLLPIDAWAATWAAVGTFSAGANCAQSTDNITVTRALNTTGADTVFVSVADYQPGAHVTVVSTLMASGWTELTTFSDPADSQQTWWYHKNITAGSDTFTASGDAGGTAYPAICVLPFSGGDLTAPDLGLIVGTNGAISTPFQLGSLDPGATAGALILSSIAYNDSSTSLTLDQSFSSPAIKLDLTGNAYGIAVSYRIETTSAAVNPTWTPSGNLSIAGANVAFKPSAGGGGGGSATRKLMLRGVGR